MDKKTEEEVRASIENGTARVRGCYICKACGNNEPCMAIITGAVCDIDQRVCLACQIQSHRINKPAWKKATIGDMESMAVVPDGIAMDEEDRV